MDQSKAYNRPGGYSEYVPSSNGTVVDLLAQILEELRVLTGPERRRAETTAEADDSDNKRREVIDSVGARALVEPVERSEPRKMTGRGLGAGPVSREDRDGCAEGDSHPNGVSPLVSEFEFHSLILRDLRKLLLHLVDLVRVQVDMDPVHVQLGHDGALLFVDDAGEGTVPEGSLDTPEPPAKRLTHYAFLTPGNRPFLSRMLCDLACYREEATLATSNWAQVTCQKCHGIGPDGVLALHSMSDDLLISLGAAPTGPTTGDEVAR